MFLRYFMLYGSIVMMFSILYMYYILSLVFQSKLLTYNTKNMQLHVL